MKTKILLFALLVAVVTNVQGQYKHCLDGEIIRWSLVDGHIADWTSSTEIVAYGDTLFNNIVYKKLYLDDSFNYFDAEESNTNWKNYTPQLYYEWENFFIRESEDASKLYLYNSLEDEEYLISDMDLQVGDTIQIFVPSTYINVVVNSIFFEDGLKHISVWRVDNPPYYNYYHTFIESVGPDIWFNYPYIVGGFLNCFQNQSNFYKINAYYPCGFQGNTDVVPNILEDNYNIFVQKDKIEIVFTYNMNVNISIYNISGVLLYEGSFNSQNIVIPTTDFSKGVYVLKMLDKNTNKQYTTKFFVL